MTQTSLTMTSRTVSPLMWAVIALILALALQVPILGRAINWDEFYHYSQVQKLSQHALTEPLQTLYTRAFVWVTDLPGTGVDHILVIRLFMLAFELATIAAIIGIASRFTDKATAVLCAVAYVSFAFVLKHGTSFRFDPPAAAMLMTAAWLILHRRLDALTILVSALLIGTSAVLTIKTVLYAPVFAGLAWLRWTEGGRRREDFVRFAVLGVSALAVAGAIYLAHSSTLGAESDVEARHLISRAGSRMFAFGNQLYWRHGLAGALASPATAIIVLVAPFVFWRSSRSVAEKVALTGLWLPLTTLLFYQNIAPYYYVYMLPPVLAASGPALEGAVRHYGAAVIGSIMLACAAIVLIREPENPIDRQRQIQLEAERMFPGGVAYFDSFAILGGFPKANVFMTPWGMEQYLAGDLPNMTEAMERKTVPLLVDDDWMFNDAMRTRADVPAFLPKDLAAIRDTFVPLWGPFWIAGKVVPAGSERVVWNVRVPGPYTVRGNSVTLDGRELQQNEVVVLDRGRHHLSADEKAAMLMWGDRLRLPSEPAPLEPYAMPF